MSYKLTFDWKITDNDAWLATRKWGKFTRSAGIRVLVSAEQNERLLALETTVRGAEKEILAQIAARYPNLNDKWSDRIAQEIMASLRRDLERFGYPIGSSSFVACDRAAGRLLQTCKGRHKRALPMAGVALHTPSLRLACGLYYGKAVTQTTRERVAWGLGSVGDVMPEPSALLAGAEMSAYVEMTRVDSTWRTRFVWMASAPLPQSVATSGVNDPPPAWD